MQNQIPQPPFADRLAQAVVARRTPVLVGLDPRSEQLPDGLMPPSGASWTEQAAAYSTFCRGVIDVVAPMVPAVKPQAAFFEELGPAGMAALKEVVDYARVQGLLVVLDGKRNDIGSTAQAYAAGYLGSPDESAWAADALTVSPYLGADSLEPFIDVANRRGCGLFVLVKTSNPGGGMFQDLIVDGRPLYRHVAQAVDGWASSTAAQCGYGAVGAVVGATYPDQLVELRSAMPHTWLLVPGYGSQGAGAPRRSRGVRRARIGSDHQQFAGDHLCSRPQGIRSAIRRRALAGRGCGGDASHDRRTACRNECRQIGKWGSTLSPAQQSPMVWPAARH